MKKNVFLVGLFLIFASQNSFPMQPITVANLFETIKGELAPKYMEKLFERVILCQDVIASKDELPCEDKDKELDFCRHVNPLSELAHFMQAVTSRSKGLVCLTELCAIKAFLKRESENCKNPCNLFYKDLAVYLGKRYPIADRKSVV